MIGRGKEEGLMEVRAVKLGEKRDVMKRKEEGRGEKDNEGGKEKGGLEECLLGKEKGEVEGMVFWRKEEMKGKGRGVKTEKKKES